MMEVSCVLKVACLFLLCVPSCGLNVVCFYTSWAQYRSGAARFTVSNINASLCTHINYAFAFLSGSNIVEHEYNDKDMWKQLNDLKLTNPSLKTFLSVGGATLGHDPFSNMVSSKENRNTFINSAISTLRSWNFSGLDIDWEFPEAADKQNLKLLTEEIASAFEMEGRNTSRSRLMLTFSVPAGLSTVDAGYNISGMDSRVDFWNLMAYDYHGSPWESSTNLPTPLYDKGDTLSVNSTVNYYLTHGASPEKILLGLAFYGRTWAVSGSSSSIGTPATGTGAAGAYTKAPGILSYYEVCDYIRRSGFVAQYENTYGYLKYGAKDGLWIGYEDLTSLEEKLKFIESRSLGGAMIWTLDLDDFSGQFCDQGTFPLTRLVASRMLSMSTTVSTTPANNVNTTSANTTSANTTSANTTSGNTTSAVTITTSATPGVTNTTSSTASVISTTTASSTTSPGNSTVCTTKYGFFPDTSNCSYYLICENGTVTRRIMCLPKTIFNPNTKRCENLTDTTYTCPNQTATTAVYNNTTAASTSTTVPTTTAATTASTAGSTTSNSTAATTASTAGSTTSNSTAATTASTAGSTTSNSTAATTASTAVSTTEYINASSSTASSGPTPTPKSQNNTASTCTFVSDHLHCTRNNTISAPVSSYRSHEEILNTMHELRSTGEDPIYARPNMESFPAAPILTTSSATTGDKDASVVLLTKSTTPRIESARKSQIALNLPKISE